MRLLLPALALLLGASPARADVLPPSHASVRHTFELRGLEAAPEGTRFFAYPTDMSGGLKAIAAGESFSFYKFAHPRIHACQGALPRPGDSDEELGLPRSDVQLHEVSSVPSWSATRAIHSVFEFRGIEGDRVLLALVSETHRDGAGREVSPGRVRLASFWYVLPALGLALLGWLGLRRVRHARS